MWRDGTALYAILKLPVSLAPDFWSYDHLPLLKMLNWGTLVLEPLIPLSFLLRRGHPIKWLLLVSLAGLHVGIVATMRLPFANLACLGATVILFREELMNWLGGVRPTPTETATPAIMHSGWCGKFAVVFIITLTLAMLRFPPFSVPVNQARADNIELAIDPRAVGGHTVLHKPLYCALWLAGLAQQYQLFDWIDIRNHRIHYDIICQEGPKQSAIDAEKIFPNTNRSALLQGYLHDLCWLKIPIARNHELKQSLALRFAQRYCRNHNLHGTIVVKSWVERITASDLPTIKGHPTILFSFTVQNGRVILLDTANHFGLTTAVLR